MIFIDLCVFGFVDLLDLATLFVVIQNRFAQICNEKARIYKGEIPIKF